MKSNYLFWIDWSLLSKIIITVSMIGNFFKSKWDNNKNQKLLKSRIETVIKISIFVNQDDFFYLIKKYAQKCLKDFLLWRKLRDEDFIYFFIYYSKKSVSKKFELILVLIVFSFKFGLRKGHRKLCIIFGYCENWVLNLFVIRRRK